MKIIEGLKQIKDLGRKADDIAEKIKEHSAHMDYETAMYSDQRSQVDQWLQSHSDILKEMVRLRIAIQRTNLETKVAIHLNGKAVTKSIAEWIHRRREMADRERRCWQKLTDRGLKEGTAQNSMGKDVAVKIVRCYDPKIKNEKIELYTSEPSTIDSHLEITNAVTDLIE